MPEHVRPFLIQLRAERRCQDRSRIGNVDAHVGALRRQCITHRSRVPHQFGMAEYVDYVVQVSRPTTLDEGADLLGEEFGDRVRCDLCGQIGGVSVRVKNASSDDRCGQYLIARQIDLDLGKARRIPGAAERDAHGGRVVSPPVPGSADIGGRDLDRDAGSVAKPIRHASQDG